MIEVLESRIAPAGIVTASLAGGNLTLTGDGADNQIHIEPIGGGDFMIQGLNGTTFVNEQGPTPFFFITNLPILGLKVDLGGGNDSFDATGLRAVGASKLSGGDGNDTFTLNNFTDLGAVTIDGGMGDDAVTFGGSYTVLRSKVTFTDAGGNNALSFGAKTTTLTSIAYTGGAGDDSITSTGLVLRGTSITANFGDGGAVMSFQGQSVSLSSISMTCGAVGAGTQQILEADVENFAVASGVTAVLDPAAPGHAVDAGVDLSAADTGRIGGTLKVTGGGGPVLLGLSGPEFTVGSALTFQPGATGVGHLNLDSGIIKVAGDLTFLGTAQNDTFHISSLSFTAAKKTVLQLGNGDNAAEVSATHSVFTGGLQYVGGNGEDTLEITGSMRGGAISAQMGTNADALTFNGALVAVASIVATGADAAGSQLHATIFGTEVKIKTGITVTGGLGITTVDLGQQGMNFSAGTDLNFTSTSEMQVELSGSEVIFGKLNFTGGNGGGALFVTTDQLVSKGLRYRGGTNSDSISLSASTGAIGLVDVNMDAGQASLSVLSPDDQLLVGGINFNTANAGADTSLLSVSKLLVAGALNVNTGDGPDTVNGGESIFVGPVLMQTKGGADIISFDTTDVSIGSTFRGIFSLVLGDGDDQLKVGNNTFGGHARFLTTVLVDAAAGNDTTALVTPMTYGNTFLKTPVIRNSETAS